MAGFMCCTSFTSASGKTAGGVTLTPLATTKIRIHRIDVGILPDTPGTTPVTTTVTVGKASAAGGTSMTETKCDETDAETIQAVAESKVTALSFTANSTRHLVTSTGSPISIVEPPGRDFCIGTSYTLGVGVTMSAASTFSITIIWEE